MSISSYVPGPKCGTSLHVRFSFPRADAYVPIVHLSDGEHRIDAVFMKWPGDTIDIEMDLPRQTGAEEA